MCNDKVKNCINNHLPHPKSHCSYVARSKFSPQSTCAIVVKADSGASRHYFKPQDKCVLLNCKPTSHSSSIHLPDNSIITSTETGVLPSLPSVTQPAKTVQVLPGLTNASLLSIGQLCDDNCVAFFHKDFVKIFKHNKVLLQGIRNRNDGLWDLHMTTKSMPGIPIKRHNLNVIIQRNKTKFQLANFYHGALGSPVISTLQKAINNNHFVS